MESDRESETAMLSLVKPGPTGVYDCKAERRSKSHKHPPKQKRGLTRIYILQTITRVSIYITNTTIADIAINDITIAVINTTLVLEI